MDRLFAPEFDSCLQHSNGETTSYAHLLSVTLTQILTAPATAELTPLTSNGMLVQTDEADMGLTYSDLSTFGRIRKQKQCGPVSMLNRLLAMQLEKTDPMEREPARKLAEKVKFFFHKYSVNRHKATVLPPAYHAESYSADDNR